MGLFHFSSAPDINNGLEAYRSTPGALLLDVRSPGEYREGRIPGSVNLPLRTLKDIGTVAPDKDTPVFVYCFSGGRSAQAAATLRRLGYTNVTDLGGITAYSGELER